MPKVPNLTAFFRPIFYEILESTNDEACRLAAGGAAEGTLVWANEQTRGRGRRGRSWISPPGNLYASLILRPNVELAQAVQLSFLGAVALGEAVNRVAPKNRLRFKWPNDILLEGRKLAGILLESSASRTGFEWMVLGIGVNLCSFPEDVDFPATCLADTGYADVTATELLEQFCSAFENWYIRWRVHGFEPVRGEWLRSVAGLGKTVELRLEKETLRGRFSDLDMQGALVLDLPFGGQRKITAGDVFFPDVQ